MDTVTQAFSVILTGIAVAGFGAGALITAPVATRLIADSGIPATFATLGIVYLYVARK